MKREKKMKEGERTVKSLENTAASGILIQSHPELAFLLYTVCTAIALLRLWPSGKNKES